MAIGGDLLDWRGGLAGGSLDVSHSLQENLLERVAAVRQTMDREVLASHQTPDAIELDSWRKNDAPPTAAFGDTLGAVLAKSGGKVPVVAGHLQLDKPPIGAPLRFEIGVVDDA